MRNIPEWILTTLVYTIGCGLILLILFMEGCAVVHEPLPGLCYDDKTGTYLCPGLCESELCIDPTRYIDPIPNLNENDRVV